MFRTAILSSAVAALMAVTAHASPLTDYNLILLGDLNQYSGHVYGRTLIGGDLNASGFAPEFGSRVPDDPVSDVLTVVGDVNATHVNMQSGNLVHGGLLNANVVHNSNPRGQTIHGSSFQITPIADQLRQNTAGFAALAATGTVFDSDLNDVKLQYGGPADGVAVFELSEALFETARGISLDAGGASSVVINVAGSNLSSGFNLLGAGSNWGGVDISNVIWNFSDAEQIDFQNTAVWGAVLAPEADTFGGASFDGTFVANSYTGGRQFHTPTYTGYIPSAVIPEPGAAALLAGHLLILACRSRSRVKMAS